MFEGLGVSGDLAGKLEVPDASGSHTRSEYFHRFVV